MHIDRSSIGSRYTFNRKVPASIPIFHGVFFFLPLLIRVKKNAIQQSSSIIQRQIPSQMPDTGLNLSKNPDYKVTNTIFLPTSDPLWKRSDFSGALIKIRNPRFHVARLQVHTAITRLETSPATIRSTREGAGKGDQEREREREVP